MARTLGKDTNEIIGAEVVSPPWGDIYLSVAYGIFIISWGLHSIIKYGKGNIVQSIVMVLIGLMCIVVGVAFGRRWLAISPTRSSNSSLDFRRTWKLFAFLLPHKVRDECWEPSYNELLEDYTLARRSYRTRWARRWLGFCFTFRTALMFGQCLRAMFSGWFTKIFPWALAIWRWFI